MADDDDECEFGGLYENGHWIWDDSIGALEFVSDSSRKREETVQTLSKASTVAIEFRDDVDLMEQIRFRRRYQRKYAGESDVITLQDIKDIAIYTAPVNILSRTLINMLHIPTTDRFLRALILYNAYYLQVAEKMASRILERATKIRTPNCDIIEGELRDNLSDLRVLVAKEYCMMLLGGGDTKNFHHMGPAKKRRSLSDKDARLFETFICISVQIVWLALGRKNFHQIELETNRILKSNIFNAVEHNLKTEYISKMAPEERAVFLGRCMGHDKKITTHSPLLNAVFCDRDISYRLMGLGFIMFKGMSRRLKYLRHAVVTKENELTKNKVSLGIIGLPRSTFDTMLRPLPQVPAKSSSTRHSYHSSSVHKGSTIAQQSSSTTKNLVVPARLYPEIILPAREDIKIHLSQLFFEEREGIMAINEIQRRRWLTRLKKLTRSSRATRSKLHV